MIKPIGPISIPRNCWDGWKLNIKEQNEVIRLTLNEFEKFVKDRRHPEQIIKQVVGNKFKLYRKKRSYIGNKK